MKTLHQLVTAGALILAGAMSQGCTSEQAKPIPISQQSAQESGSINPVFINDSEKSVDCSALKRNTSILSSRYADDRKFTTKLELEIEKEFDVELLGKNTSAFALKNMEALKTVLGYFGKKNVQGLTLILGDSGSKNPRVAGTYSPLVNEDGSLYKECHGVLFLKDPSEMQTAVHELMHHTHMTNENRAEFELEWGEVSTLIRDGEGKISVLSNSLAREVYKKLTEITPVVNGNFGFMRTYSAKDHFEDVATFSGILKQIYENAPLTDEVMGYWDSEFNVESYMRKLDLLEKYDIMPINLTKLVRERIQKGAKEFASIRENPASLSYLPCDIGKLANPQNLNPLSSSKNGCTVNQYNPSSETYLMIKLCGNSQKREGHVWLNTYLEGKSVVASLIEVTVEYEKGKATDLVPKLTYNGIFLPPTANKDCGVKGVSPGDQFLGLFYSPKWTNELEAMVK
jgi:hypothetical protein